MARFKEYSYSQGVFKTIFFEKQILPGTFEYTLNYLGLPEKRTTYRKYDEI